MMTEEIAPKFHHEPSGNTKTITYTVWSLDVWGHSSDECCGGYGCSCIVLDENADGTHDDDHCDAEFTVNDRCEVGTIECTAIGTRYNVGSQHEFESFSVPDEEFVRVLMADNFLKPEVKVGDLDFDGDTEEHVYVEDSKNGRPIFELEKK